MWPDTVAVVSPDCQCPARIGQVTKNPFVRAFVMQTAIGRLGPAVLLRLAWIDVMPLDGVVVGPFRCAALRFGTALLAKPVPLSPTLQAGLPKIRTKAPGSRATLGPEMLVSGTRHRFSRQPSSLTARIRNFRQAPKVSDRTSSDQRRLRHNGTGIGVRLPRARVRPRLRRTDRPSCR